MFVYEGLYTHLLPLSNIFCLNEPLSDFPPRLKAFTVTYQRELTMSELTLCTRIGRAAIPFHPSFTLASASSKNPYVSAFPRKLLVRLVELPSSKTPVVFLLLTVERDVSALRAGKSAVLVRPVFLVDPQPRRPFAMATTNVCCGPIHRSTQSSRECQNGSQQAGLPRLLNPDT